MIEAVAIAADRQTPQLFLPGRLGEAAQGVRGEATDEIRHLGQDGRELPLLADRSRQLDDPGSPRRVARRRPVAKRAMIAPRNHACTGHRAVGATWVTHGSLRVRERGMDVWEQSPPVRRYHAPNWSGPEKAGMLYPPVQA
jgi:hypothetical protein